MIELDQKIKTCIDNCVVSHKRCTFILTGPQASENVPVIFSIRNYDFNYDAKILWCFKRDNSFIKRGGKNNRKFEKSCKKMNVDNEYFENFTFSYDINWCHYNDTDNILGMTFDACVLQDFDSMTPNKLAKVIETVKGGGLIIFLLPNIAKISDFGSLPMDAHKKYQTFAYDNINCRFNYRFFYSLIDFRDCFLLDNNLHVLPINHATMSLADKPIDGDTASRERKLSKLKKKLSVDHEKWTELVAMCATKDQTRALITLIACIGNAMSDKGLQPKIGDKKKHKNPKAAIDRQPHIAMVTAGRGRGKSALLGITIAAAVVNGYQRICVTSPNLQNVGTLMEFVITGLERSGYRDGVDFTKTVTTIDGKSAIVAIEIVKDGGNRQIVRYVAPGNSAAIDEIDLLCIDETAAIPLPMVRQLLAVKCRLFCLSSTIHGYEGTGRSLSLKLMKQIREDCRANEGKDYFSEISLTEPIRYSSEDNTEKWLNNLLCLDCGEPDQDQNQLNDQPTPSDCKLFLVNRDALFSGSPRAEQLLQQLMAIYVSSHYKNTPNDLQMLADCSSHALYCLARPSLTADGAVVVCAVVQIAFEGNIDPVVARTNLEKGNRPSGDMIPWTVVQQFNLYEFSKLSGARIVRIAVHPSWQRQGYGGQAIRLLVEYFSRRNDAGAVVTKPEIQTIDGLVRSNPNLDSLSTTVSLPPVDQLGPLLTGLTDTVPESIDYIGVSYGLTPELLRFWKKNNFSPVYLRQTTNDATGEHSCIMLRQLAHSDRIDGQQDWLRVYNDDFNRRFCKLLPGPFRNIDSVTVLEILHDKRSRQAVEPTIPISPIDIGVFFTKSDIVRVERYLKNLIDYHGIIDLLHGFAFVRHTKNLPGLKLPKFQDLVLVALGLQYKSVDELAKDLSALQNAGLSSTSASEILGHLRESVRTMVKAIKPLMK